MTAGTAAAVLAAGICAAAAVPAEAAPARAAGLVRADDGARITAEKRVGAHGADLTIASPALGRSVKARILLPPGWRRGTACGPVPVRGVAERDPVDAVGGGCRRC